MRSVSLEPAPAGFVGLEITKVVVHRRQKLVLLGAGDKLPKQVSRGQASARTEPSNRLARVGTNPNRGRCRCQDVYDNASENACVRDHTRADVDTAVIGAPALPV